MRRREHIRFPLFVFCFPLSLTVLRSVWPPLALKNATQPLRVLAGPWPRAHVIKNGTLHFSRSSLGGVRTLRTASQASPLQPLAFQSFPFVSGDFCVVLPCPLPLPLERAPAFVLCTPILAKVSPRQAYVARFLGLAGFPRIFLKLARCYVVWKRVCGWQRHECREITYLCGPTLLLWPALLRMANWAANCPSGFHPARQLPTMASLELVTPTRFGRSNAVPMAAPQSYARLPSSLPVRTPHLC